MAAPVPLRTTILPVTAPVDKGGRRPALVLEVALPPLFHSPLKIRLADGIFASWDVVLAGAAAGAGASPGVDVGAAGGAWLWAVSSSLEDESDEEDPSL